MKTLIEALDKKELAELLGKCWMTHDGVWFMSCAAELGMAAANRLNKSAIRALAPIEVGRFRKRLSMEDGSLKNSRQVYRFFQGVREIAIPDFMGAQLDDTEDGSLGWGFGEQKCFAWRGMQRMGVIQEYECGVLYRIQCWLDALGVNYEMTPRVDGGCIDPANGTCRGVFRLHFPVE